MVSATSDFITTTPALFVGAFFKEEENIFVANTR
jgi:hypothetical protein